MNRVSNDNDKRSRKWKAKILEMVGADEDEIQSLIALSLASICLDAYSFLNDLTLCLTIQSPGSLPPSCVVPCIADVTLLRYSLTMTARLHRLIIAAACIC